MSSSSSSSPKLSPTDLYEMVVSAYRNKDGDKRQFAIEPDFGIPVEEIPFVIRCARSVGFLTVLIKSVSEDSEAFVALLDLLNQEGYTPMQLPGFHISCPTRPENRDGFWKRLWDISPYDITALGFHAMILLMCLFAVIQIRVIAFLLAICLVKIISVLSRIHSKIFSYKHSRETLRTVSAALARNVLIESLLTTKGVDTTIKEVQTLILEAAMHGTNAIHYSTEKYPWTAPNAIAQWAQTQGYSVTKNKKDLIISW